MGMIRWLNRHRWGFPLLWAVPALLLAAVSRTWRVGTVFLVWIPLAVAVAWLYFTSLEKENPAQLLEEVRSWLERPESLRLQVMDHYHAACCLRALGRTEEARLHLEFAAAFGGGLEVRRWAADLLKELQRPETP